MGRRNPPLDPEAKALVAPDTLTEEQIIEFAEPLPEDTEDLLGKLQRIQGVRSQWTNENGTYNQEYEALRDAASELLKDGPRYFIDAEGIKMVAARQQATRLVVNPKILAILPADLIDKVAPRKIDNEQFKRAVKNGKIKTKDLLRYAELVDNAAHVKFIRADGSTEG